MSKIEVRLSDGERSPSLGAWLRFDERTRHRYEAEHGAERVATLRVAIYIGLFLYNAYNLTSIALLPDIIGLSGKRGLKAALRLGPSTG